MSKKRVKLRKSRVFSEEFKRARVGEYESGEYSVGELSRLFEIQSVVLYRWIHKFSTYNKKSALIVEMKDSATKKLKEYEKRIADLERALGQKQLNIDYLEKLLELGKEHFNIDLKKNLNTPPSTGSQSNPD